MRTDADYPRTLIVSAHFSEQSGTGTFLGRLFSGWPIDRLATIGGGNLLTDWRRCGRHYRIGDLELRLRPPFNWLVPASASGPVQASSAATAASAPATTVRPAVSFGRRLAQYPWRGFLRCLGGGEILYRVGPSPQLMAWVAQFKPDILYGHFSSLNSLRFLRRTQQSLGLPIVLHFMDDFPEGLYRGDIESRLLRPRYLAEFAQLVRSADAAIAICQEMAQAYEQRYRRKILSLPMPVELDAYRSAARTQWTANHPFRLRYGGRVGWAIRESLADLARATHALRQQGADVAFNLVTFNAAELPAICRSSTGATVQIPGPLADLPRLQAEADVLIICYDFDPNSFRQARYSMPGKLAECMASGTPILVYGPPGLPVVEYARREGWGKVVDRRDPTALQAAVGELMASAALREQLGRTAQRLAAERHNAETVSKSFRAMLQKALRNTPEHRAD